MINSRYSISQQLANKLGRTISLATDSDTDKLVVLKEFRFNEECQWQTFKLFEREVFILKSLEHPSIPKYLDYFETETGFCLVQEYIDAVSLQEKLDQHQTFCEAQLKQIAQSVLEILIYLHKLNPPVIHRDIKPSNILVSGIAAHSVDKVYLIDFGAAQTIDSGGTRTVVGTYDYMPFEQFGSRAVPASDFYALGATLIHLATGIRPGELLVDGRIKFRNHTNISHQFKNWLEKMTEPVASNRFNNATEALAKLQSLNEPLPQEINSIPISVSSEKIVPLPEPGGFGFSSIGQDAFFIAQVVVANILYSSLIKSDLQEALISQNFPTGGIQVIINSPLVFSILFIALLSVRILLKMANGDF